MLESWPCPAISQTLERAETTSADQEIIRLVVERVEVHVRAETECGEVVISWRGGVMTATRSFAGRGAANNWAVTIS